MKKHIEFIKIFFVLLTFIFLLTGCGEKSEKVDTPQVQVAKKTPVKGKQVDKKIKDEVSSDDENLEDDFKDEEIKDDLNKDFEETADTADESDEDMTELETANSYSGRIKKITLQPEIIRADSDVELFVHVVPGINENESILINFRKNGTIEVGNSTEKLFKKELYRKGDLVSFDIMLVKGEDIIEEKKLGVVTVVNSNPKITRMPSITRSGFKVYTYDVRAEDPDGDAVTFELTGDVPPGMTIDGYTGRITYNFTGKPPKDKYEFNVSAKDSDGGEDARIVTLVFKSETRQRNS